MIRRSGKMKNSRKSKKRDGSNRIDDRKHTFWLHFNQIIRYKSNTF